MSEFNPRYTEVSTLAANVRDAGVPVLNPENEAVVDVIAATDSDVDLAAWINPGILPGEELVIRNIRRSPQIVGGVDVSNKATIYLKVIEPGSRVRDINYEGFKNEAGAAATLFAFPAFSDELTFVGPALAIFRWSGTCWVLVKQNLPAA